MSKDSLKYRPLVVAYDTGTVANYIANKLALSRTSDGLVNINNNGIYFFNSANMLSVDTSIIDSMVFDTVGKDTTYVNYYDTTITATICKPVLTISTANITKEWLGDPIVIPGGGQTGCSEFFCDVTTEYCYTLRDSASGEFLKFGSYNDVLHFTSLIQCYTDEPVLASSYTVDGTTVTVSGNMDNETKTTSLTFLEEPLTHYETTLTLTSVDTIISWVELTIEPKINTTHFIDTIITSRWRRHFQTLIRDNG